MDHLRHDLREAPAFAVYCHRHCGVPLGLSRIPDVASLARGVLAVELECHHGKHLTVLTGLAVHSQAPHDEAQQPPTLLTANSDTEACVNRARYH